MRFIFTLTCLFFYANVYSQAEIVGCKDTIGTNGKYNLNGKLQCLHGQSSLNGDSRVKLRSCYTRMTASCYPLLIVDEKIMPLNHLSVLNPHDIIEVTLLKSAQAMAIYGPDGVGGAFIIKLKALPDLTIKVLDNLEKSALAKATVTFVSPVRGDTLRYIADDSGRIVTNSARELVGCRMIVSAAGYRAETRLWSEEMITSDQQVFLSRALIWSDDLIIGAAPWGRKIMGNANRSTEMTERPTVNNIYPNPAIRGKSINISCDAPIAAIFQVRLTDPGGILIYNQSTALLKGNNSIKVLTRSSWPPSVYFLQVVSENGFVVASGKIIIQ